MDPDINQFKRILADLGEVITDHRNTEIAAAAAGHILHTGAPLEPPAFKVATVPSSSPDTTNKMFGSKLFNEFISGATCLTGVSITAQPCYSQMHMNERFLLLLFF